MIIVTGATGFIGSNLIADLNALGLTDIVLVDELGQGSKWKNIAKRDFQDLIHFDQAQQVMDSLPRADAVFHLGADSSTTATDGDDVLRKNLHASMAWWRWCTKTGTPLIYASSAATYGDGVHGFDDELTPAALVRLAPLNLYGWSKHAFDKWALAQASRGACPPQWAGLKFFNVYGPNEYHKGEMKSLVAKNAAVVSSGGIVTLFKSHRDGYADGAQLRDFVYVKDCCKVMTWLMTQPTVNGIFNLGTGAARSFVDLVNAIGSATKQVADIAFIDMPLSIRANYQYYTQAQMGRLRQAGYDAAFYTLEDGVADYVNGYLLADDPYR